MGQQQSFYDAMHNKQMTHLTLGMWFIMPTFVVSTITNGIISKVRIVSKKLFLRFVHEKVFRHKSTCAKTSPKVGKTYAFSITWMTICFLSAKKGFCAKISYNWSIESNFVHIRWGAQSSLSFFCLQKVLLPLIYSDL